MQTTPHLPPGTYTLREVLNKIVEVVEAEPRRINMRQWDHYFCGRKKVLTEELFASQLPECGTIACAAGWGHILLTGQPMDNAGSTVAWPFFDLFLDIKLHNRSELPRWAQVLNDEIFLNSFSFSATQSRQAAWLKQSVASFLARFPAEADSVTARVAMDRASAAAVLASMGYFRDLSAEEQEAIRVLTQQET